MAKVPERQPHEEHEGHDRQELWGEDARLRHGLIDVDVMDRKVLEVRTPRRRPRPRRRTCVSRGLLRLGLSPSLNRLGLRIGLHRGCGAKGVTASDRGDPRRLRVTCRRRSLERGLRRCGGLLLRGRTRRSRAWRAGGSWRACASTRRRSVSPRRAMWPFLRRRCEPESRFEIREIRLVTAISLCGQSRTS